MWVFHFLIALSARCSWGMNLGALERKLARRWWRCSLWRLYVTCELNVKRGQFIKIGITEVACRGLKTARLPASALSLSQHCSSLGSRRRERAVVDCDKEQQLWGRCGGSESGSSESHKPFHSCLQVPTAACLLVHEAQPPSASWGAWVCPPMPGNPDFPLGGIFSCIYATEK